MVKGSRSASLLTGATVVSGTAAKHPRVFNHPPRLSSSGGSTFRGTCGSRVGGSDVCRCRRFCFVGGSMEVSIVFWSVILNKVGSCDIASLNLLAVCGL